MLNYVLATASQRVLFEGQMEALWNLYSLEWA